MHSKTFLQKYCLVSFSIALLALGIVLFSSNYTLDPVAFFLFLIFAVLGCAGLPTKTQEKIKKVWEEMKEKERRRTEMSKYVCSVCHYIGEPKSTSRGSCILLLFLFLFFIIPGIFYLIWMMATPNMKSCPMCHSPAIVPVTSPLGRKIYEEQKKALHKTPEHTK